MKIALTFALILASSAPVSASEKLIEHPQFSGIYPHLAFFNDENECGTGAVVPWADRLWAITYAPHMPKGSTDKLYEIDRELNLTVRPESIGGTPANRMIHRESGQLFIGPYAIDDKGKVRTIRYERMVGRPTGLARHLTDPAGRILLATMEEGIYEIGTETLEVKTLWGDTHTKFPKKSDLPGYHGKGFYSGQGVYVYSNNGEWGKAAKLHPETESGVLAEWDGGAEEWTVIRRNQFTEVTGPGGIHGNPNPATDPVWAVGWDHKSLLLGVRMPETGWTFYRLPKGSHSYDGAHGWNTEWPRIREIGEGDDLLMTMHGMFWKFPRTFTPGNTAGIAPRSTYLKVVGDFCRWGDQVVLGCDDTARSEFLNKRKAKGEVAAPQSQSNLWFVEPGQLDHLGPVIGRGGVWLNEKVDANDPSDPFLVAGFGSRAVHLYADKPTTITIEADADGTGKWSTLATVEIDGYRWHPIGDAAAEWIRLRSPVPLGNATAWFTAVGDDRRQPDSRPSKFDGLAKAGSAATTGGIVRARAENKRTLHFASEAGYYELGADAKLRRVDDPTAEAWLRKHAAIPSRAGVLEVDAASVLYTDDAGRRWRLPRGDPSLDGHAGRLCREVATERDLFNVSGTFYELPAENAGGFAKLRPVATHNLRIDDFCSYRGLLVLSGIEANAPASDHIVRSGDGRTALWLGAVDDLWALGKPVGTGGPWKKTAVEADAPGDPYLMTGYGRKTLTLSATNPARIRAEIDITGTGDWRTYRTFSATGTPITHRFPSQFQAYWIRFTSDTDTVATAQLDYR